MTSSEQTLGPNRERLKGASDDLRDFLRDLETHGLLRKIEGADWDLEIGTLTELMALRNGPVLLFDRVKGYPAGYRVTSNMFTPPGMATALGLPPLTSIRELVNQLSDRVMFNQLIPHKEVKDASFLSNIMKDEMVDLFKFPVPRWHELDGGRYIGTGCAVVLQDPDEGWVNVGTYRVQIHSSKIAGISLSPSRHGAVIRDKYWARGDDCPIAVIAGLHPLLLIPSFVGIPWRVPEYSVMGGLLGRPLEVVRLPFTNLPVPAQSEIVIEGVMPTPEAETHEEGPFGEYTGYYGSKVRLQPVIKVKAIYHRDDPLITGTPPLKPPGNANSQASNVISAAHIWSELKEKVPAIKGVWQMAAGCRNYLTVISLKQSYPGHARQAAMAALGGEGASMGRFVIVVDDEIDPFDEQDVLWAVATRCDPATAIEIIHGAPCTPLDPLLSPEKRKNADFTSSRAILYACKPYHWMKEFPVTNKASPELAKKTLAKWAHLFETLKSS